MNQPSAPLGSPQMSGGDPYSSGYPAYPPFPPEPAVPATVAPAAPTYSPRDWLVRRRNAGDTPAQICQQLVAQGWDADTAGRWALGSLRASDRHRLLYIGECWGAGLSALGAASAVHIALAGNGDAGLLAFFLTLMLVAAPIALYCGVTARRVEAAEPHAIWSPTRRSLFALLGFCAVVVGLVRLVYYTFELVAAGVGVSGYHFRPASVIQVLIVVSISLPLSWWSLTEWRRSNVALRSLAAIDEQAHQSRAAAPGSGRFGR